MENNFLVYFLMPGGSHLFIFFSQLLTQDVQLAPICNCVCVSNLYCKGTKASKGEQKEIKVIYCTDRCKIEL